MSAFATVLAVSLESVAFSFPQGIYLAIAALGQRYGKPVMVTENGLGTDDDRKRQAYLRAHLFQVELAQDEAGQHPAQVVQTLLQLVQTGADQPLQVDLPAAALLPGP